MKKHLESRARQTLSVIGLSTLIVTSFLSGCSTDSRISAAPVDSIALDPVMRGVHRVASGESLAEIAHRYGRNYQDLAQINGIKKPYRLKEGQLIALSKIDRKEIVPSRPTVNTTRTLEQRYVAQKPKVEQKPASVSQAVQAVQEAPRREESIQQSTQPSLGWAWPAKGQLVSSFQDTSTNKGIQIENKLGTPVKAVKSGKVVYSGQGLRGYGRLLIIKHDDQYLSAYAHNHELLVKEGQYVQQGQTIATMGQTDASKVQLHFELRHNGKPVDPLKYLSKDQG